MSRERESYRDNLQRLDEAFPDRELLTATDVARYEHSSRASAIKRYKFNSSKRISKCDYARQMSS